MTESIIHHDYEQDPPPYEENVPFYHRIIECEDEFVILVEESLDGNRQRYAVKNIHYDVCRKNIYIEFRKRNIANTLLITLPSHALVNPWRIKFAREGRRVSFKVPKVNAGKRKLEGNHTGRFGLIFGLIFGRISRFWASV